MPIANIRIILPAVHAFKIFHNNYYEYNFIMESLFLIPIENTNIHVI